MSKHFYSLKDILSILKDNEAIIKENNITSLSIFGSFSTGKETPESDLDIIFTTTVKGLRSFLVDDILQDLLPNIKVHALNKDYVKQSLITEIKDDLVKVF